MIIMIHDNDNNNQKVSILIPSTWAPVPEAEDANNVHEDAEIRVEPPSIMHGDSPYTLQTGQCGEEGQYTQVNIMSSLYLDTIYYRYQKTT